MKKLVFILTVFFSYTSNLFASDWQLLKSVNNNIPNNVLELSGAFKGKGKTSKDTAYIFVYNVLEDGEASGRYNVYLLADNQKQGRVLEAEFISPNRLGLYPLGLDASKEYIDPKIGSNIQVSLELRYNRGKAQLLLMGLKEDYEFTKASNDLQISFTPPTGNFADGRSGRAKNSLNFTPGTNTSVKSYLDIKKFSSIKDGYYFTHFQREGLSVFTKEVLDNNFRQISLGEITAVAVEVVDGKDRKLILSPFHENGDFSPVILIDKR